MVQYYYGNTICANPTTPFHFQLIKRYTELTGSPVQVSTDDFAPYLQQEQLPSKLLVLFPNEAGEEVLQSFRQDLGVTHQATIVRGSYGWFLEVLHPQVSKGHGFARMLDHLHIPITQSVAFGDADNDMEFLQMAGLGVAMLNAKPLVQDIADQVTEWTNDDDGVIRTLQAMEKEGLLLA
jgi:hydroxymethylpyrimidine pyrophosphatase-like HAD family hydrolase